MTDEIATLAEVHEADALPRKIDVHCDSDADCAPETLPEAVTRKPVASKSAAEWAYERLVLYIRDFESQLDAEQEIAMGFTGGQAGVLRIEGMGYFDPDIVTFYGVDEQGIRTQLIQHVTQLGVTLRALPRIADRVEPRRIGFRLAAGLGSA